MAERKVHPYFIGMLLFALISGIIDFVSNSISLSLIDTSSPQVIILLVNVTVQFTLLIFVIVGLVYLNNPEKRRIIAESRYNLFLYEFFENAYNWQIGLFLIGSVIIVADFDGFFTGSIGGFVLIVIVVMIYNENRKIKESLSIIIPQYPVISLTKLKELIPHQSDTRKLKRLLLQMIIVEGFPAHFDPSSGVVSYGDHPSVKVEPVIITKSDVEPVQKQEKQAISASGDIPKLICPYCGEEAEFSDAKFCQGCGASLGPAK